MTHYNIDYGSLEGTEKQQKALADIREYLGGWKKFNELTALFRDDPTLITQKQFTFALSFAGIQGYPVVAWWKHCFPHSPWEEQPEAEIINLAERRK